VQNGIIFTPAYLPSAPTTLADVAGGAAGTSTGATGASTGAAGALGAGTGFLVFYNESVLAQTSGGYDSYL
jgi:hypothetical protein